MGFGNFLIDNLETFLSFTGFANATTGHWVMLAIGLLFIFLAIRYEFEPLLLIPIGFGMLIGNILFTKRALCSISSTKGCGRAGILLLFSWASER